MLAYRIVMVLYCTVLCCSQPHIGFFSKRLGLPEVVPRTAKPTTPKDCFCYNKAVPNIADILKADQQRQVVYLYKDANNNLNVYTPSREKQLLLPDLGLERGDELTNVGQESAQVHKLFNPNNAVVLKRNDVDSSINRPIVNSAKDQYDEGKSNLPNSQFGSNSSSKVGAPGIPITLDVTSEDSSSTSSVAIKQKDNLDISPENSEGGFNFLPGGPVLYTPPPTNPAFKDGNSPVPETLDNLPNSLISEDKQLLKDDNKSLYEPGIPFNGGHLPFAFKNKGVPALPATESSVDIPKNPELSSIPSSGSGLPSIYADETTPGVDAEFPVNKLQSLNEQYSPESEYVTFDKWFDQQMQRIQNIGKSPNTGFDLFSLKQQTEKSLFENGMYVTKDGVLIDSEGAVLNVANLKLRPILIGDSVAYDSVFTGKDDKFVLPSNLRYLEAVLVTSVAPPKILGVIPLGKTYIPRVSYRSNFDYSDLKVGKRRSSCPTGRCFQQHIHKAVGCKTGKCPQQHIHKAVGCKTGKCPQQHIHEAVGCKTGKCPQQHIHKAVGCKTGKCPHFEVHNHIQPQSSQLVVGSSRVQKVPQQLGELISKNPQSYSRNILVSKFNTNTKNNDLEQILKSLLLLDKKKKPEQEVSTVEYKAQKVASSEYKGSDGYAHVVPQQLGKLISKNPQSYSRNILVSKGVSYNPMLFNTKNNDLEQILKALLLLDKKKKPEQEVSTVEYKAQKVGSSEYKGSDGYAHVVPQQLGKLISKNPQSYSRNILVSKGVSYNPMLFNTKNNDLEQVLKSLLLLDKKKKPEQEVSTVEYKAQKVASSEYKGSDGYAHVFEVKPSEEETEVVEVPWFRIIGGNAATSSGTPVSSRGRSGNPYLPYHNRY